MTSYYYCIDPVLSQAEKGSDTSTLITVSRDPCACQGHVDDCFVLANPVHILRLDDAVAVEELAQLMKDVPLYHFNMELVLDEALAERHRNKAVLDALNDAFNGAPLPQTLSAADPGSEKFSGNLRHPVLEHMDTVDLSRIYVDFLLGLRRYKEDFSFQRNILGHHPDRFLAQFDGFFEDGQGKIRSNILLAFGLRLDHDPHKPLESYVHSGQMEARKKNILEAHELIWAWLECDNYQQRRCRDIHRVMSLTSLPRMPNWVRLDIFRFLEMEAMKQVFSEKLIASDSELSTLSGTLQLKRAIRMNAAGQVDECLQQLLGQTLNTGNSYSGAAARFVENASFREKESHKIKLG